MTGSTLYELADLRDVIDAALAESEGELTDDLAAKLDAWEGAFADKVERVALYIRERRAQAKAIKEEASRLSALQKRHDGDADRLEAYLHTQLLRVGKREVNGLLVKVALAKNPPSVVPVVDVDEPTLRNMAMWAADFIRHDESWSLNRAAILAAYKAGTLPADVAKLVEVRQTERVSIR